MVPNTAGKHLRYRQNRQIRRFAARTINSGF